MLRNYFFHISSPLGALLLICCLSSPPTYSQEAPISIEVTTIDYPPLMGLRTGLMTELVVEAFKTQSIAVDFKVYPMSRIVWSVTRGESDAALGTIDWLDTEEQNVLSSKIYETTMHFFYKKQKFSKGLKFKALRDLNQYRIGYILNGSLTQLFENAKLKPEIVPSVAVNAKKLSLDRLDMFAASHLGGWSALKKLYPEKLDDYEISEQHIYLITGDIMFPKNNKHLHQKFENGFQSIKNNGTYLQILEKYFGQGQVPSRLLSLKSQSPVVAN